MSTPAALSAPRIAVDCRALVPEATGIGVYTRENLRSLAARGVFRYLGLAHDAVRGADELAAWGVPVEVERAPLGVLWQQRHLARRVARGDIDLLWSPLQTQPLSLQIPGVITVHDLTVLLLPDAHRWKVRWSQVPFLERSLTRAARVVAVSQATADDLRFHFPAAVAEAGKLVVIHPGVRPGFVPASAEQVAAIRHQLGCPEGYLLYAGTLEPRKNVGAVVDAWFARRHEDPTTPPLLLAGGYGWRSRELERRIRRLEAETAGALRVLGWVEDAELIRLLQGATLFVYPSFYEGFGLPVVEAMACGVPVVTSDRSSLPEVAGKAALLVPPEEPSQLAGALRHLLAHPELRAELAGRGLERARRFRWDAAAAPLEQAFSEALARGGPRG